MLSLQPQVALKDLRGSSRFSICLGDVFVWWPLCLAVPVSGGLCFSRPLCLADSVFGRLFSSPVLLSARVASVFGSLCSSRCRVLARGFLVLVVARVAPVLF